MHERAARWITIAFVVSSCGTAGIETTTSETRAGPPDTPAPIAPPTTDAPSATPFRAVLTPLVDEAVLEAATGEKYANPGGVTEVEGRFHMLRNSFSAWPGDSFTHHLVSDDGITWETNPSEPIITGEDVVFGDESGFAMAVLERDGEWFAYVYTYDGTSEPGSIGVATAPSPEGPWDVRAEPVVEPGPEGSWDAQWVSEPSVVQTDDGVAMYFAGTDGESSAIGLATSTDGLSWTKHDGPVLTASQSWWDGGTIKDPQVVRLDDGFLMTFDTAARGQFAMGVATSPDGVTWTAWDGNPALTTSTSPDGEQFWQSELLRAQDGRVLQWLEVGPGASRTDIHLLELDIDALEAVDGPVWDAEVDAAGSRPRVRVRAQGVSLRFAPGSEDPRIVHPHVYIDRPPPEPGSVIPTDDDTIVHAGGSTVTLSELEPGDHELWLVAADGADRAVAEPAPVRLEVSVD